MVSACFGCALCISSFERVNRLSTGIIGNLTRFLYLVQRTSGVLSAVSVRACPITVAGDTVSGTPLAVISPRIVLARRRQPLSVGASVGVRVGGLEQGYLLLRRCELRIHLVLELIVRHHLLLHLTHTRISLIVAVRLVVVLHVAHDFAAHAVRFLLVLGEILGLGRQPVILLGLLVHLFLDLEDLGELELLPGTYVHVLILYIIVILVILFS